MLNTSPCKKNTAGPNDDRNTFKNFKQSLFHKGLLNKPSLPSQMTEMIKCLFYNFNNTKHFTNNIYLSILQEATPDNLNQ